MDNIQRSFSKIRDVDLKILSELNDENLFNVCLTNRYTRWLCNNETFWRDRFYSRFGKDAPGPINRKWKNYYLLIIHYLAKYGNFSNLIVDLFENSSNTDVIMFFLKYFTEHILLGDYDLYLFHAARNQNLAMIKHLLSLDANKNDGLEGAAASGDMTLVEYFVSLGATNWDTALYYSAKHAKSLSQHEKVFDYLIGKGANIFHGLAGAAAGGNLDILKHFINLGANDFQVALEAASDFNKYEIAKYLLSLPDIQFDLDMAVLIAIEHVNIDLIKLFIEHGANNFELYIEGVQTEIDAFMEEEDYEKNEQAQQHVADLNEVLQLFYSYLH